MGVADTTAPASFGTASDLRTAANPSAQHSADSPWLPLTTNARGIYFAAAIDPTNPCYNTAEVLQCPADTDLALLREAFEQLYRENEGFRVRTRIADGAASQQILPLEAFLEGIDLLVDGSATELYVGGKLVASMGAEVMTARTFFKGDKRRVRLTGGEVLSLEYGRL